VASSHSNDHKLSKGRQTGSHVTQKTHLAWLDKERRNWGSHLDMGFGQQGHVCLAAAMGLALTCEFRNLWSMSKTYINRREAGPRARHRSVSRSAVLRTSSDSQTSRNATKIVKAVDNPTRSSSSLLPLVTLCSSQAPTGYQACSSRAARVPLPQSRTSWSPICGTSAV
jgi:hypothetical protein